MLKCFTEIDVSVLILKILIIGVVSVVLSSLIRKGAMSTGESTVVVLTGSGLKATDKIKILMQ